ncbi:MAG: hypothetical protein HPY83_03395 [Anaerolineae bacterium]|nr:hypothetical protein [Anaerolineae bacterium]
MSSEGVQVTWPWSGDILNRHDGVQTPKGLRITVRGTTPADTALSVTCNGRPAHEVRRRGARFEADVLLHDHRCDLTVRAGEASAVVPVLWDRDSFPRYRFSIDDNILFLKDLAQGDYPSLFDHWYLAFWRSIHQRFGTKVHVNIYYQTDPSVWDGETFRLPQMPDRFMGEWQDNADWLRLTFHARQNKPDRPYKDAGYDELARDYDMVTEQIRRFAGDELTSTFTTVHWAEATRDGVRALRDRGVKGLIGLFDRRHGRTPYTRYYLSEELADHVAARDYWWDPDMDMLYVSCDMVVNSYALDEVLPRLEAVSSSPHTSEVIELLIHEQYFRRELSIYQPDAQYKVVRAVEWVSERGYRPVFWSEGFIGA